MFALGYNIAIGKNKVFGVFDVEIKRSITEITGTAKLKLPSTAIMKRSDGTKLNVLTAQTIKRGDPVEIELGYNGKMRKEFSGYVSRVNLTQPIEIECEDGAFLLKEVIISRQTVISKTSAVKKNVTYKSVNIAKSYKNSTIEAVLLDIFEGTGIDLNMSGLNINIDKLLLCTENGTNITRLEALQKILDDYGLVGYFDTDQNFFAGLRQGNKLGEVKLKLGWNTLKDDDLKYHNEEDEKIKIKAIYINKLGTRTEVEIGDNDGSIRTIFLSNVKDESQLKTLAENELKKYKFTGFSGKITAFLQPFCEPAYVCKIEDPQYSQRSGSYYCEGIEVSFGTNGARRKILIGAQI